jgi:hypothetical protein
MYLIQRSEYLLFHFIKIFFALISNFRNVTLIKDNDIKIMINLILIKYTLNWKICFSIFTGVIEENPNFEFLYH